ncbi:hypothetical protein OS175_04175 [Marinicella sp. S1101]|uniref:hypothetical protein n=1 Tax=Marinicella marina TaxID=2996016 RepID=UPI00226097AF|nr:hypothetical protein [Marinicella marina]MCX7553064.1 hypothetical protein [Marinicella marina]MDJ1139576.1 hypothetical protein [Marinicella marina]
MNQAKSIALNLTTAANQVLSKQARTAVSATTGMQPFTVGPLGNFPYYWQDPQSLVFNAKTYDWIDASLKANTSPIQQGQPFTNLFIAALSKVSYSLSQADQNKLNQDRSKILLQQTALLQAWKDAFGQLPSISNNQQAIDTIINKITQTWASPPVSLTDLQHNPQPRQLLNQTPEAGQSVVPVLVDYLNALGAGVSLLNAVTMNDAYLHHALLAVQRPDESNGGLLTNDGKLRPAYAVKTPLKKIIAGLNAKDRNTAFSVSMQVSRSQHDELIISQSNQPSVKLPSESFLSIKTKDEQELFDQQVLPADSDEVTVQFDFSGLTTVYFTPVSFLMSSLQYWYWVGPINAAIRNGDDDVSGYKFSPQPQIDFSKSGPFGYLYAVAISKYPTVTLTVKQSQQSAWVQKISAAKAVKINFLEQPIGDDDDVNYSLSVIKSRGRSDSLLIKLQPLEKSHASINSTAYVHGVLVERPTV